MRPIERPPSASPTTPRDRRHPLELGGRCSRDPLRGRDAVGARPDAAAVRGSSSCRCDSAAEVAEAIRRLAIRGAPLIGVAAAYGVAIELARDPGDSGHAALERACDRPARRPADGRQPRVGGGSGPRRGLAAEPAQAPPPRRSGRPRRSTPRSGGRAPRWPAAALTCCPARERILTHCNTGALAAPGSGTALGGDRRARRAGQPRVRSSRRETRPLLQGARLTVYELARLGIAHELIVDSAAAGLIAARRRRRRDRRLRPRRGQRRRRQQGRHVRARARRARGRNRVRRRGTDLDDRPGCPSGARDRDRGARPRRGPPRGGAGAGRSPAPAAAIRRSTSRRRRSSARSSPSAASRGRSTLTPCPALLLRT